MTYCATTDVEGRVGKIQVLGVHDGERLDVPEPELRYALLCLAQHRLGNVDAAQPDIGRIVGQRHPGADADFKNAAADAFGGGDRGVAAVLEHRAEHQVIDRRPSRIGLSIVSLSSSLRAVSIRIVSVIACPLLDVFALSVLRHAHETAARFSAARGRGRRRSRLRRLSALIATLRT